MPFAIDEEALASPNMKVLDMSKPPLKQIPHQSFPKMVYLHPVDKTKEHRAKVVHNDEELEAAMSQGWKTKQHVPQNPPDQAIVNGEFETEPVKRGPGRPRNEV